MKHSAKSVDSRIRAFMDRKTSQYPDLSEKPVRKIHVRQRGRFFDDLSMMFATNPAIAKLR